MHNSPSACAPPMKRRRFVALALVIVLVALGGASATSAKQQPAGPPDTYVAAWDAIGSQAFSAAALSPAEGHTIFAYLAIAVYDSVMAIEGGYEPFAIDVDVPDASPQAAVAAAAHRVLAHYLPAQAPTIIDPAYATSLATIPDGQTKTNGIAVGESVAQLLIAKRSGDGFRAPVTYTPPNPPIPGVWVPTAPTPPIGTYLGLMQPVQPRLGRPVPPWWPAGALEQEVGDGVQRGQGDRLEHEHDPDACTDPGSPVLGGAAGAAGTWLAAEARPRPSTGRQRCGAVDGDGLGDLCRRTDRVLRCEVPLRVLEADHCDPGG